MNVDVLPDGWVARRIEGTVDAKIAEALKGDPEKPEDSNALKKIVTPWLVGGEFHVHWRRQ